MKNQEQLDDILKGRFITRVLKEQAKEINQAQVKYINTHGFNNADWITDRNFTVEKSALHYVHSLKHRFVDMKTRNTKEGKKRKKAHPIHNRIIWGHYNNIITQLSFGFTEAVKQELRQLEN